MPKRCNITMKYDFSYRLLARPSMKYIFKQNNGAHFVPCRMAGLKEPAR